MLLSEHGLTCYSMNLRKHKLKARALIRALPPRHVNELDIMGWAMNGVSHIHLVDEMMNFNNKYTNSIIIMIYPIISRSYESNCYIVVGKQTALIDSGIDPEGIFKKIDKLNISIDFLINTHCHYDHIGADLEIVKRTGAKICVHKDDAEVMENGDNSRILFDLFGNDKGIRVDLKLDDGQVIDLGNLELNIIHTPGHTPGGICIYEPKSKSLFSGDTIFSEGVGRTDLSGGNPSDLKKSIEKILGIERISGIEKLYPGHGPIGSGDDIERIYGEYF